MGKLLVGGILPAVEGILAGGHMLVVMGRLAVEGTQAVVGRPPVVGGTRRLRGTEVQKLQARKISKLVCRHRSKRAFIS